MFDQQVRWSQAPARSSPPDRPPRRRGAAGRKGNRFMARLLSELAPEPQVDTTGAATMPSKVAGLRSTDDRQGVRSRRRLPARRRAGARSVAAGRRQHPDPCAGRSRRRGDQGREARPRRRSAQLDDGRRGAVVAGLRPQQEEPVPRSAPGATGATSCCGWSRAPRSWSRTTARARSRRSGSGPRSCMAATRGS